MVPSIPFRNKWKDAHSLSPDGVIIRNGDVILLPPLFRAQLIPPRETERTARRTRSVEVAAKFRHPKVPQPKDAVSIKGNNSNTYLKK